MSKIAILCIIFLLLQGCRNGVSAERFLSRKDFKTDTRHGIQHELHANKVADLGNGVAFNSTAEVTAKGNGFLQIANLNVRIYDAHDNSEMFTENPLEIYLVDINSDGYRDLLTCIVKEISDEKGNFSAYRPEFFLWIFIPEQNAFGTPFGIFDPYSAVRDYFKEIPLPERRIVLPQKYRLNRGATLDQADLVLDDAAGLIKIVYGIQITTSGTACCLLKIYRDNRIIFEITSTS
ncbi:MAG: hypothetical protein LBM70_10455 [Victivallales bacterium]|jgi:hypothetical protein|nr:hypothetical protein [Victivallales bacterium]